MMLQMVNKFRHKWFLHICLSRHQRQRVNDITQTFVIQRNTIYNRDHFLLSIAVDLYLNCNLIMESVRKAEDT